MEPEVQVPTEPQATEPTPTPEPTKDPMIPKSRFDEINGKYKEMADRLAAIETEKQAQEAASLEAERKRQEEQGKFEELYREAESKLSESTKYQSRAEQLESLITAMVDQKIESIGKDFADLIPEGMTPESKLEWINKAEAKGLFGKKEAAEIGGRKAQDPGKEPKVNTENISALDKIKMGLGI